VTPIASSILGIDVGTRRVGVAVAELDGLSARPLATITLAGRDLEADRAKAFDAIEALVREQGAVEIVVGLPLEANGEHGPMAEGAREFAAALGSRLGLRVTLRDERLSSHVAEARLGPMPRGRAGGPPSRTQRGRYRARVDREAAAVILQDELDARRSPSR
jgi:putative Holliday junction resolvase